MLAGHQGEKSPGWIQSGSAGRRAARRVAAHNLQTQKQAKGIIMSELLGGLNEACFWTGQK